MQYSQDNIESMINDLGSKDQLIRRKAHNSLFAAGELGVSALVKALSDPRDQVRRGADKLLGEINVVWANHADAETLNALVNDLSSQDGIARVRARHALVTIGGKSVDALSDALEGKNEVQRWEAAKALGQIGDPAAMGVLIKALEYQIFDLRWLAAEGLITIGKPTVVPLLHKLIEHSDSVWLREGAHHVLHDLHDQNLKAILRPVLDALEDTEKRLEIPLAAEVAIKSLK